MDSKNRYLPQLDTLKLFAMMLVFSTHCYFLEDSPETQELYNKYFVFSGVGVEFFIIISGFFAAYTYKKIGITEYLKKKINRLFPVHWLCLIIGGYLLGVHCGKIPYLTPLSIPLLQSLSPISGDTNPPSWTISTLFILYIITPFLIDKLARIPHRLLLPVAVFLCIISTVLNCLLYNPSNKLLFYFLYVSPYYRVVTFSIGILLGLYVNNRNNDKGVGSIIGTLIEMVSVILIVILMTYFHKVAGYWYTLPIFLLLLVFSLNSNGLVSKILSLQCFQKLAKVSYCFYLIHYPILSFGGNYLQQYDCTGRRIMIIALLLSLGVSLFAAYILNKYIEKPFVKNRYLTFLLFKK